MACMLTCMQIFGAFYKMGGTTQDAYFTEIAPYGLRDKMYVIKQTCDALANLFSGFVSSIPWSLFAFGIDRYR